MQRILILILGIVLGVGFLGVTNFDHSRAQTQDVAVTGQWDGALTAGGSTIHLSVKISKAADGSLSAKLDSPDQNASDIPIDVVTYKERALHFELKAYGIGYDGVVSADGAECVGTFKQGGAEVGLILRRAGSAPVSTAPVQRGRVPLKPCDRPGLTRDALCGSYEVFEDRAARSGRKIALNLVLLPATGGKAAPDALFYLVGGPGGAATNSANASSMGRLRRERDVVLVDQRGTGASNPLNCRLAGDRSDMAGYFGETLPVDKVRACRAELEKVANLKLYTTTIAMDDLDEVRSALGYDRIDVYGGSYGSTAALVYLRQHPDHVRAVAIFGVAPPDAKLPLSFAGATQHALDRLFADCAADPACHQAYPKLAEEFAAVLKRFDNGPVEIAATNPYTGQRQQFSVPRVAFVNTIRHLFYAPNATSAMPLLIHTAAQGDLGPLFAVGFQVVYQIESTLARGMQLSVMCAEDTPFITEADIKSATAASFFGDTHARLIMKACAEWPSQPAPASFLEPVKAAAPVLMVSGELDPVTPPWIATGTLKALSNSRQLIVHNATHNSYPCVEGIVADFIDKGSLTGLDTSCVDSIRRPPFNLPPQ